MFADILSERIAQTSSMLCAGLDPSTDWLPSFATQEASRLGPQEEFIHRALLATFEGALEVLGRIVACVKPNAAFFEQYGVGGYRALRDLSLRCRAANVPVILDAKRGDIGSTAQAYANAYLTPIKVRGTPIEGVHADALTVNPFLGFETIAPFISSCVEHGKGLFVLVKTSNPGSSDIQDLCVMPKQETVSDIIARMVDKEGERAMGTSGLSSIGAVVGATYPEEAARLRALMPRAIFLVPGFGSQGGSAEHATSSLIAPRQGAIINMSRGLFQIDPNLSRNDWLSELERRALEANRLLQGAADARFSSS
jgi:orotidine-5'-phosphate decarboxylase